MVTKTRKCKSVKIEDASTVEKYKKMQPCQKVTWHLKYAKQIKNKIAHTRNARLKPFWRTEYKAQLKAAEGMRKKHGLKKENFDGFA